MLDNEKLVNSIRNNLLWFENSGIMDPANGKWGIAERIFLTENNNAIAEIVENFPANTIYEKYGIVEHRRPDCNFEATMMFLAAKKQFGDRKHYDIADNLLFYLYQRSGLLNRVFKECPDAVWNWSNEKWIPTVWFDDNAWNCVIPLLLAKEYPHLDHKYEMRKWSMKLAYSIVDGFEKQFNRQLSPEEYANGFFWHGNLLLPHWGSLVSMAMAAAYSEKPDSKFRKIALQYNNYINSNHEKFNSSEYAYIVIGESFCSAVFDEECFEDTACKYGDLLIEKMHPETGNIPSEHHEAPNGKHLADTIYTVNWALLALQNLSCLYPDSKYKNACKKIAGLLIDIQDRSNEKHLCGCWRGMYDLNAGMWGGGDKYEGGANSIYSGWTNAPITIGLINLLSGKSLISSYCE